MESTAILDNMKNTTQAVVNAFTNLDYSALRGLQTEDFVYKFLPQSLGAPIRNKQEYSEYFPLLTQLFKDFNVTISTRMFDAETKQAMFHGTCNAEVKVDALPPYELELIMMLTFSDDGKMVREIREFFDSDKYKAYLAKVEEWQASQK